MRHTLRLSLYLRTDLEGRLSMMLVVEDEEGAERAARADGRRHLHQRLVLLDQPVVALLRLRQLQVWDV